jgi:hypothetical protein
MNLFFNALAAQYQRAFNHKSKYEVIYHITNPAEYFNHKSKSFKGNKRKGM